MRDSDSCWRIQVEAALDDEMSKMNNLDEDDYSKIRSNRIAEMKRKAEEQQGNVHNGHGKLTKINDQQEFFAQAKKSNRMIAVFTRNSNKYGKAMLEHAELLAGKHLEAKFIWVDAENAPFLTDRLNIYMLPTIVCIKDNKVHRQHNGLNEIDGTGKYSSGMLEYLLHSDDMLDEAPLCTRPCASKIRPRAINARPNVTFQPKASSADTRHPLAPAASSDDEEIREEEEELADLDD